MVTSATTPEGLLVPLLLVELKESWATTDIDDSYIDGTARSTATYDGLVVIDVNHGNTVHPTSFLLVTRTMMNSIDESDHSVKRLLFIFGAQGVSFARLLAQASTSDQRGVVSLAWADPRLSDLKSQTRHPKPQSGSSHLILLVALNASEDLTRSAFCSMGQKDTCSMFSHTHTQL